MKEVNSQGIFLILGFLAGFVIMVIITYFLNKKIFKRNFIYQESLIGKIKDVEVGPDGHTYVIVQYKINGKEYEAKIRKTKLVPSKQGFPVYIDVNSLNPSEALPHSIIPLIISIIVFIVAIVSFIIIKSIKN